MSIGPIGPKSFFEVLRNFPQEKTKDLVKIFSYSAFWAGRAVPSLPSNVQTFSLEIGQVKNLLSAIEIPRRANGLWNNLQFMVCSIIDSCDDDNDTPEYAREQAQQTAWKVFKESSLLINNVCDGIAYSAKYIAIDKGMMQRVSGVNSIATIAGCGAGAVEQVYNLTDENKDRFYHMLCLARDVSYVAVGALGLYAFVTATAVAPWVILATLTTGLTFSILAHFYSQMCPPDDPPGGATGGYIRRDPPGGGAGGIALYHSDRRGPPGGGAGAIALYRSDDDTPGDDPASGAAARERSYSTLAIRTSASPS